MLLKLAIFSAQSQVIGSIKICCRNDLINGLSKRHIAAPRNTHSICVNLPSEVSVSALP